MSLPISYQVLGADYLFLKEANQDIMQNSSMQTHTQPLVLLQAALPPAINASYGPLSVARAVPLDLVQTVRLFRSPRASAFSWKIQAFVLTRRVLSSAPKTQEVRGSCSLGAEGDLPGGAGAPAGWFSPAEETSSRERQGPEEGNAVELYYRARPSSRGGAAARAGAAWRARPPPSPDEDYATPMLRIRSVRLLQVARGNASVSQLKLGDSIIIQTSSKPLKKTDIATFYVFMSSSSSLDKFTLKATVKKGMSFCTATPSNSLLWDTTLDTGADGTISIVCQKKTTTPRKRLEGNLREILQLDFEAEELSGHSESQVITWRLELPGKAKAGHEGTMRIYTTQRDFVGLAPLVTDTEILNTAVLTGKRVTVPVRTVAVEQDGSVTDVSEFTDCRSTNEDILKVSDRCDYVFVNGKEMRGKVKMAVNFTYSYLSAQLEMTVWIPRLPLQIEVSDSELSQIKGWRVPIVASKRTGWDSEEEEDRKGKGCMLQFQHALVRVLTHFVADRSEPREQLAYFLGEDWQVDVTKLVRYFLKVGDPRVARLQAGRVLSGRDFGVTTVQVMSPLSDSILAEKTVTVLDDKVTITELGVQLVSGLSLSLQLSPGSNRAIVATATTQEVLQRSKQEAVISSWIQFSDGSLTPLDIYEPSCYTLAVTSLDEGVVSVRRSPAAVVAEGEGQGALLRVELLITEPCQKSKRKSTLAVGSGTLKVSFQPGGQRPSNRSNSGGGGSDYGSDDEELGAERKRKPQRGPTNRSATEREESAMRKVTTTARSAAPDLAASRETGGDGMGAGATDGSVVGRGPGKGHGNLVDYTGFPSQVEVPGRKEAGEEEEEEEGNGLTQASRPLTDLEIGMYALLGVFCLAILVFLVNCTSYAVKFGHKRAPAQDQEPRGHRHDWVWLGTDAELVMNVPGTPPPQDSYSTTVIDIAPAADMTASLGRGAGCEPQAEAPVGCMGSLRAKAGGASPCTPPPANARGCSSPPSPRSTDAAPPTPSRRRTPKTSSGLERRRTLRSPKCPPWTAYDRL
ncbi:hypothetical protein ANANG_G00190970 [Anguilla anguilla]|uniref:Transmembrane protein 132D n=1 Tax=Anguilla anguilla TaxID=7936 RepID=A0A9D3M137_ANGAN|nr:hypothetical protein ANANG_G00190970 [Anguilla anguilla]